jgi:plastocyanin
MRTMRVGMAAAAVVIAGAVAPAAQATVPETTTVQFGAVGTGATSVIENSVTPSALHIRPGGTVTFNVDGFHQPVAYRLRLGESFEEAFARLDARVADTDANGVMRLRMAGQDTFVAPDPMAPPTADRLTLRDLLSGYLWLSATKPRPGLVETVVSPPAPPGRYVLLCNVPRHYKFDVDGQRYSMSATLLVG